MFVVRGTLLSTCLLLFTLPALADVPAVTSFPGSPVAKPLDVSERGTPQDPPGILDDSTVAPVADLARRLSRDRRWLRDEVVAAWDRQSLRLDELFADAPEMIAIDDVPYRVVLEKVGPRWQGFDPVRDPFLVFLTHEVYDAIGPEAALAYRDGEEMVIFEWDFELLPAVALTLVDTTADERPTAPHKVSELRVPIQLGEPRLAIDRSVVTGRGALPRNTLPWAKNTCEPQVAPTSCVNGKPSCGAGNYAPFFFVDSIKIKDDHEGCCFKGSPEIDLFAIRVDDPSNPGGTVSANTNWIFSGRTVSDLAGFSRYLPDINNTHQWYSISGGLAIFPVDTGNEFGATLIEDDSEAGKLKIDNDINVVFKLASTIGSIITVVKDFDVLKLIAAIGSLIDLLGNLPNDDDLYVDSLGFRNSLFCNDGLGQPFPKIFSFVTTEWEMKGYFACADSTCTPPPPSCLSNGQICETHGECCSGNCVPTGFGGMSACEGYE